MLHQDNKSIQAIYIQIVTGLYGYIMCVLMSLHEPTAKQMKTGLKIYKPGSERDDVRKQCSHYDLFT